MPLRLFGDTKLEKYSSLGKTTQTNFAKTTQIVDFQFEDKKRADQKSAPMNKPQPIFET